MMSGVRTFYGQSYVITDAFMQEHPGGYQLLSSALESGINDLTLLFEANHLDIDKARKRLEQFRVRELEISEHIEPADYEKYSPARGLHNEMRQLLLRKFQEKGLWTTRQRQPTGTIRILFLLSALLFIMSTTMAILTGSWFCIVATGILTTVLGGFAHTAVHSPYKEGPWIALGFHLCGLSAARWSISHVVRHHCFPNNHGNEFTEDPYLRKGTAPFLTFHPSEKRTRLQLLVQKLHPILYMVGNLIDHIMIYTRLPLLLDHPRWFSRVAPILIFPCLWLVYAVNAPGGMWEGTCIFLIVQFISSFHFLSVALANHNQDECWSHDLDFNTADHATWQIHTNVDIRLPGDPPPGSVLDLVGSALFLFLNHHTYHHLFPAIDPSHYDTVHEVVESVCMKHNIKLVSKYPSALYINMVKRMAPK